DRWPPQSGKQCRKHLSVRGKSAPRGDPFGFGWMRLRILRQPDSTNWAILPVCRQYRLHHPLRQTAWSEKSPTRVGGAGWLFEPTSFAKPDVDFATPIRHSSQRDELG